MRGADKPSRGTSGARGEQESTETLSFRCDYERCRLTRGAVNNQRRGGKAAFTLAEVLITLGIIGVVAALTMPALITNIQDRIQAKRIENINQKLSKVTDKMAVQSGLTGYGTTMAFVQEMSKYMKIAKICDNNHLAECWPTEEVILNDEGKTWEISKTKNAKTLKIPKDSQDDWDDTVGIITADGTGMLLSYNKKCEFNVDDSGFSYSGSKSNSLACLSGVYDWNGSSKPNKLGKDVTMLGLASGLGNNCAIEAGGKCFTAAFKPTPLTIAQCNAEKDKLGIKSCTNTSDYWAGAVKQCGGVSKMPTSADLKKIGQELYDEIGTEERRYDINKEKAASMGFDTTNIGSAILVFGQKNYYYNSISYGQYDNRTYTKNPITIFSGGNYNSAYAVCIGD